MKRYVRALMAGIGLMVLAGCAGHGEVITLNLRAVPPFGVPQVENVSDTIVVVTDFEDARPEKQRLGTRVHAGGGESYFNVPSGNVAETVGRLVADYLKKRGWRVQYVKAGAGDAGPDGGPHVTISGKVLDFSVDAKSRVGSTNIKATTKIVLNVLNAEDGSTVRMTLSGVGTKTGVSFDPKDAEELLSVALSESLEKFVSDTQIEKKILKLR